MRVVADLHIHSRHSIATSPKLTPPHLDRWARVKGIDLLGTGDCTHPAWLSELQDAIEPAEEGLFRLKSEVRHAFDSGEALEEGLPEPATGREVRFVLSGEISTIYSRDGKTRKVHHVVLLPDFEAATAFQARLERVGNISSDGRPILGLDSRDLFRLLLEADDRAILIPAHIWTPWFSALGGRSGFDSIEECYGDFASRIPAIETGLSSNPPMNWAVSALDRFAIVSNSDAHSPEKLGREATILSMEESFAGLSRALYEKNIHETIEFFQQEGKYHWDGHRACKVALSPEEAGDGRCPVCGKPLTPGVLRRVVELADRPVSETELCPSSSEARSNQKPYRSLIPLKELLGELMGMSAGSKKVSAAYNALIRQAGSEFDLLLGMDLAAMTDLRGSGVPGKLLSEAVGRMREGRVSITPGYDGEYGVIRAFAPGEGIVARHEAGLFGTGTSGLRGGDRAPGATSGTHPARTLRLAKKAALKKAPPAAQVEQPSGAGPLHLDPAQERAVNHPGGPALVLAGPGTGKTSVLTQRIARIIESGADPASILALTFTNKAAGELRDRLDRNPGKDQALSLRDQQGPLRAQEYLLTASTFHAFCLAVLRDQAAAASLPDGFAVLGTQERESFLEDAAATGSAAGALSDRTAGDRAHRITPHSLESYIESRKRFLLLPGERKLRLGPGAPMGLEETLDVLGLPVFDETLDAGYAAYREALKAAGALDFDDLVSGTVRLLAARPEILSAYRIQYRFIFVDEYQDVNFAQYALLRLLVPGGMEAGVPGNRQLFVIGDPNQAIYSFRGADRRFIERFKVDYPDATVYSLSRSFRCAPAIIGAASRLMGTELEGTGSAVALMRAEAPTAEAEAEGIAREIDRMIGGTRFFALDSGTAGIAADTAAGDTPAAGLDRADAGAAPMLRSLGECAVLVRAAALALPLEKALKDHGLPYRFTGDTPWWEEEPARSTLSLLRAAIRPEGACELRKALETSHVEPAQVEALRSQLPALPPAAAVLAAAEIVKGTAANDADRDSIERLASHAAGFRDLSSLLDALALGSPQDGPRNEARQNVSLMTIHAAKGLEFDHVFVAGLEEGILPFTLFDKEGQDDDPARRIDEERRLLYVAVTRARIGLHLWHARTRIFRGRKLELPPSRFLFEIEDLVPQKKEGMRRERDPQLGLF
jgi:DNA helicase II / ATP-dependent DNA helicase PcrA